MSANPSPDPSARPDPAAVTAELQDRQAILAVLHRYCRAMDRMDHQLGSSVWHPGGTADYGVIFEGTGQGFVDWVMVVHAGLDRHSHQIANVLLEVNGDVAASEAYVTANLRAKPDDNGDVVEITSRGRYLDRWSRRNGCASISRTTSRSAPTNCAASRTSPMMSCSRMLTSRRG